MDYGRILDIPPAYGGGGTSGHPGVRERIRPNSAGAKNVWNEAERPASRGMPMGQTMGARGRGRRAVWLSGGWAAGDAYRRRKTPCCLPAACTSNSPLAILVSIICVGK